MVETAELRMSEAVPLAHALVTRLAELEGIRILFIKGPTAVALGVRPPRPSTDVDVLCEPGGLERLGPALERCGWRRRVPESLIARFEYAAKYMFEHSVHYIHDEWPCDLDVHFNFPGFLAPDGVVFEELWRRHATVDVANWAVPCADLLGQAAIVALHSLRDPNAGHTRADLEFLIERLRGRRSDDLAQLSRLASATGSSQTLRPLLLKIGAETLPSRWTNAEQLRRWTVRSEDPHTRTVSWLIELRHTPWLHKPALMRRALFLSRQELMSSNVGTEPSWRDLFVLQARRWARGTRHLWRSVLTAGRAEPWWGRGGAK